jgi:hypothetical protein
MVLAQIDERAKQLNVPRSRYLVWLAQHDLAKGGDLAIPVLKQQQQIPPEPPLPPDDPEELAKFLEFAIPALEAYRRNLGNPTQAEAIAPPSETDGDKAVWEFFLEERDEILKLKWLESEKAGRDIGWEMAIQIWMREHRRAWVKAHPPNFLA